MTNRERVELTIQAANGVCEDIIKNLDVNDLQLTNAYLSILAIHFKDISRSLADIADSMKGDES